MKNSTTSNGGNKLYCFTTDQLDGFVNEVYSELIQGLNEEGFIDNYCADELSCNYKLSCIRKDGILQGLKRKLFPEKDVELNNRGFRIVLNKVIVTKEIDKEIDK